MRRPVRISWTRRRGEGRELLLQPGVGWWICLREQLPIWHVSRPLSTNFLYPGRERGVRIRLPEGIVKTSLDALPSCRRRSSRLNQMPHGVMNFKSVSDSRTSADHVRDTRIGVVTMIWVILRNVTSENIPIGVVAVSAHIIHGQHPLKSVEGVLAMCTHKFSLARQPLVGCVWSGVMYDITS